MQNDGGITASGAFFDSVVAKSDFVISGYILSVIFQIVATVRLILSGLGGSFHAMSDELISAKIPAALKAVDREFDIGFLGFPDFPGICYFGVF